MWITARPTHEHPISGGKPSNILSILRNFRGTFVHNRLWITGNRYTLFFWEQEWFGEKIHIWGDIDETPSIWGV